MKNLLILFVLLTSNFLFGQLDKPVITTSVYADSFFIEVCNPTDQPVVFSNTIIQDDIMYSFTPCSLASIEGLLIKPDVNFYASFPKEKGGSENFRIVELRAINHEDSLSDNCLENQFHGDSVIVSH